ncbi:MAG TPA: putative photosynthetic complex assembly protein PuhE [Polyangiaceae bacterium LLY-WYZ-15_(1-7)]|nr:hypothetical protein [Myxococcales bacterium]MAT24486.1 hypothetical protein [Sandaracinus sp.]HJK94705.1 putative photosynthetic complex assembly protein PuhE [Polyangiaceae bacterium LLY-WYZ-15_(1-7)]MBJ73763.1 hypothetical protein [Sandaracinus sp.]HJL04132.1 putative photosynthetic complex assembly protein PuhE [Polyangiaceae bacterium LLY-WYZ-15_(1-7)]
MGELALASLVVLGAWWLGTAVVLRLVWLRRATHGVSLAASSVLAAHALWGVVATRELETPGAAYLAFGCALAIWAWHELSFLLGVVTGPRKVPSPPGARGWRRFRLAAATVIHHEIALAATAGGLVALTWGAPNRVASGTFLVLWAMRLSAKLNVFLGVRNISEQFVPARLKYLVTYFRRARLNPLMPVSLVVSVGVTVAWAITAGNAGASFEGVSATLLATILGLAALEHLFLAVPLPDALLWSWVLRADLPASPGVEK